MATRWFATNFSCCRAVGPEVMDLEGKPRNARPQARISPASPWRRHQILDRRLSILCRHRTVEGDVAGFLEGRLEGDLVVERQGAGLDHGARSTRRIGRSPRRVERGTDGGSGDDVAPPSPPRLRAVGDVRTRCLRRAVAGSVEVVADHLPAAGPLGSSQTPRHDAEPDNADGALHETLACANRPPP